MTDGTGATHAQRELARRFQDDGVAIVRGLVPLDLVARARGAAASAFDATSAPDPKLPDGWRSYPAMRELAVCPEVIEVVESLYGRRAIPFQTLTFRRGSEQRAHADSVHFDTIPSGWMCGVWVALEDVGPRQGPLSYHPGSNRDLAARAAEIERAGRTDYPDYEAELAVRLSTQGSAGVTFEARAGDAVIWAAHLVHGGSPVVDPVSTRWSQVTHYFFDGCVYVTPMSAEDGDGRVSLRDGLTDLRTGRRVAHVADGRPARLVRLPYGQARILSADEPSPALDIRVASAGRAVVAELRWRAGRLRDRFGR